MGVRNLRAICPECGGKIRTEAKGLGHFTITSSWFLVKTPPQCPHCGTSLSGKVAASGKAITTADADKPWYQRQ